MKTEKGILGRGVKLVARSPRAVRYAKGYSLTKTYHWLIIPSTIVKLWLVIFFSGIFKSVTRPSIFFWADQVNWQTTKVV